MRNDDKCQDIFEILYFFHSFRGLYKYIYIYHHNQSINQYIYIHTHTLPSFHHIISHHFPMSWVSWVQFPVSIGVRGDGGPAPASQLPGETSELPPRRPELCDALPLHASLGTAGHGALGGASPHRNVR